MMACVLLLWILGAVMFFVEAGANAKERPDCPVARDWLHRSNNFKVICAVLWWLWVLWELAGEARNRWQ